MMRFFDHLSWKAIMLSASVIPVNLSFLSRRDHPEDEKSIQTVAGGSVWEQNGKGAIKEKGPKRLF